MSFGLVRRHGEPAVAEVLERARDAAEVEEVGHGRRIERREELPEPSNSASLNRSAVEFDLGEAGDLVGEVGLNPASKLPNPPVLITKSARKAWSICVLIVAFVDSAKIVMNETSATPIISAAAVAEVRFGFRIAFSRAIVPGTPAAAAAARRGSGSSAAR